MKNKKNIYIDLLCINIYNIYMDTKKGGDFVWYLKEEDRPMIPKH